MDPPNLLLLLLLMFASPRKAEYEGPGSPVVYCGSTGNFTSNSAYDKTRSAIFNSISTTNSSSLSYGFCKDSVAVSGTSQTLYVFGLCRGDLTAMGCRACLIVLALDTGRGCRLQKEALLYNGNCTIRYSDTSFFGTVARKPTFLASYIENASSPEYPTALGKLLNDLLGKAAVGSSLKKYASGNEAAGFYTVYALVQCMPDLTEQQCKECLGTGIGAIKNCCAAAIGGRFMVPSCLIIYEINQFFDPEPLPPPPPTPGKINKPTVIAITIVVPIGGVMVLLFITCCLLPRKRKKMDEVVERKNTYIMEKIKDKDPILHALSTSETILNCTNNHNAINTKNINRSFLAFLKNRCSNSTKNLPNTYENLSLSQTVASGQVKLPITNSIIREPKQKGTLPDLLRESLSKEKVGPNLSAFMTQRTEFDHD